MKNHVRTTTFLFSILTIILACTKEVALKTEVEFSLTEQHETNGYVNENLSTTITVVPEEILEEFSYSYSYSVSKGGGHFQNRAGEIFPRDENIALDPLSATVMYVGAEAGEHTVKVTATDNYGFTEEVEIGYILAEVPPVVWTATSTVKRIELGNSATITVNFEKSEAIADVDYERRYLVTAGSGSLIEVAAEEEANLTEFQSIKPGTYALNFTPEELGIIELSFNLKGDDSTEFTAELSFEVLEEIVDTVIPEITLTGEDTITVQTGSNYKDAGATALDDVDGDISGDITIDTSDVDMTQTGTYRVTYNVSDSAGNAAVEVVRTVEVIAGDDPRSAANDILSFAIDGQVTASIFDENKRTINLNVPFGTEINVVPDMLTLSANATVMPLKTTRQNFEKSITYTVTAENGNRQDWTVIVTVNAAIDGTPPVITLGDDQIQNIEVGQTYVELGATATDDFDGNVTENIVINSDAVNTNKLGDYSVTYNVSDIAGNIANEVTRTVRVVDTTAPVISLLGGNLSIAVGQTYIEPGYSATDNLDGNITGKVTVGSALDINTVGVYEITYDVVDDAGNAAVRETRTVEVTDTTPPVITLNGNSVTLSVGDSFTDPGFGAADNADGDLTGNVAVGGDLNTNAVGNYTVTYNVSDSSGNPAVQKSRSVQVVDTTAPVITLIGGTISVGIGQSYTDPGYSAADNVDGNITSGVVVGGNVDTNVLGTYTLTYNVSDAANNAALQRTRVVRVVDDVKPIITLTGGRFSVKVNRNFIDPGYTASDNIDGNITGSVVVGGNLNTSRVGIYTVRYDVSDNASNNAVQRTRTVEVTPLVTSYDPNTGIYRAPANTTVTVSLNSGGSAAGTAYVSGGGGRADTCWGTSTTQTCTGTDSYTFVMPASGSVTLSGNHSGNGSSDNTNVMIESNDETQNYSMN